MLALDTEVSPIKPLVHNRIEVPGGRIVFTASCFEGRDWSLAPLQKKEDAAVNREFAAKVGGALSGLGARRAYAPNPTQFNGKVISPANLRNIIPLPGPVFLCRNQACPADSTSLNVAGDAGLFSAGGCGMLVIVQGQNLLFGHAGRESLLDRQRIKTNNKERSRDKDLVDNMLDVLGARSETLKSIYAWPLYFIKPQHFGHRFDDPDLKHAAYNQGAILSLPREFGSEYGWKSAEAIHIDLPRIARTQLINRGVPKSNIFLDHAYLADELPTTRNGGGRYLTVVVRQ